MKNNIKSARESKGYTQQECADIFGVKIRSWQTYEQGVSEPKYDLLCRIADTFGVTTDYLLGREMTSEKDDLSSFVKHSDVKDLEEILIRRYLELSNDQRESVLNFLRRAIQEEAERQGITVTKWETVKESARNGNGTQIKTYPATEGEKADNAPFVDSDL